MEHYSQRRSLSRYFFMPLKGRVGIRQALRQTYPRSSEVRPGAPPSTVKITHLETHHFRDLPVHRLGQSSLKNVGAVKQPQSRMGHDRVDGMARDDLFAINHRQLDKDVFWGRAGCLRPRRRPRWFRALRKTGGVSRRCCNRWRQGARSSYPRSHPAQPRPKNPGSSHGCRSTFRQHP